MISYHCPHCRAEMEAPADQAGQTDICPFCGEPVRVPRCGDAPVQRSSAPSRPPLHRPSRRKSPGRGRRRTIWTLVGLACAFGGLAALVPKVPGAEHPELPTVILIVSAFGAGVLAIGLIPGAIAYSRRLPNADGIDWLGLLGILLFGVLWLVALVLALIGMPGPAEGSVGPEIRRHPCPRCGESIAVNAKVCRFCGAELG
jgi:hypothetical protein